MTIWSKPQTLEAAAIKFYLVCDPGDEVLSALVRLQK